MSFPANIAGHRRALLEMLQEACRDPDKRTALRTSGVSMEPLLRARDEVVIRAFPAPDIAAGDVIAFRQGDLLLVHRVVAIGPGPVLYEKGDNNLYLSVVAPERVLGVVTEVVAAGRRLDLRAPRFRRLGRAVATYGRFAVRVLRLAQAAGRRLVRPGSAASRVARRVVVGLLQSPPRLVLTLARNAL